MNRATLRLLWHALYPDRRILYGAALGFGLAAVLTALGPYWSQRFIDHYLIPRQLDLPPMVGLLAGAWLGGTLSSGLRYWQRSRLAGLAMRSVERLRQRVFAHTLALPLSTYDRSITGQLVSRITNDTESVKNLYVQVLYALLDSSVMMLVIALTMTFMDARLAWVVLVLVPIVLLTVWGYKRMSAEAVARTRELRSELNAQTSESIAGMAVLQTTSATERYAANYTRLNWAHYASRRIEVRANAIFLRPVLDIINTVLLALVMAIYGWRTGQALGPLEVGVLYAFIRFLGHVSEPLFEITAQVAQIQQAFIAAGRVQVLLDEPAQTLPVAGEPLRDGRVEIEHLHFAYTPGVPVLRDVSLHIAPGEFIGIVGATGSGKTTLLSLLLRFYPAGSGDIRLGGVSLAALSDAQFRAGVGVVAQEPFLVAGSVRSNVAMGRPLSDAQVLTALRQAGATATLERLPSGLDTRLGEGGARLSSGEKQLIAMARALAGQPQILLLDEATSHIDSETEQWVQESLMALRGQLTQIAVAHRLSTIRAADRIVVMQAGQIAEIGPHEALMQIEGGIYRRLVQLQALGAE